MNRLPSLQSIFGPILDLVEQQREFERMAAEEYGEYDVKLDKGWDAYEYQVEDQELPAEFINDMYD